MEHTNSESIFLMEVLVVGSIPTLGTNDNNINNIKVYMDSLEKEVYLVKTKSSINKELDRILNYAPEMEKYFSEIRNYVDQGDLIKVSNELKKLVVNDNSKELDVDIRFLASEVRVMLHKILN
jgi:hypothetical protein